MNDRYPLRREEAASHYSLLDGFHSLFGGRSTTKARL
jgi:hypothetical protein